MIVYLITNKINNKRYVGITIKNIEDRFAEHAHPRKKKNKSAISEAILKYGKENFSTIQIDVASTIEELKKKEIYWIKELDTFQNEYNLTKGGDGMFGCKFTQKTKDKIKLSTTKRMQDPEVRKNLSEKTKIYFKNHPEQRIIRSKQQKERAAKGISEETCNKISKALTGKKKNWSIDGKERLRKSVSERMKRPRSESFKEKMRKIMIVNNPMNSLKYREMVGLSKIGKKRFYREDGTFYMSFPENPIDIKRVINK